MTCRKVILFVSVMMEKKHKVTFMDLKMLIHFLFTFCFSMKSCDISNWSSDIQYTKHHNKHALNLYRHIL